MHRRGSAPALSIRPASIEDGEGVAALYGKVAAELPGAPRTPAEFELMAQTGHAFLVALVDDVVHGAVRYHDDDGIAWLELLAADVPGVGRRLLRAIETGAQDRGLRLVRMRVREDSRLPAVFGRWGFLPIAREGGPGNGSPVLVLEKRLALLTVREQRRGDAAAIGALTGEDPWVFEQGARPGWFVAADGDRVVGAIGVRDADGGVAVFREPALSEAYRGRGIEVWMIERCALYSETNGYHTAELPLTPITEGQRKALEDRFWERGADRYVRRFLGNLRKREEEWE